MNFPENQKEETQTLTTENDASTETQVDSPASGRDPECRTVHTRDEIREKMLDKTLADSFPTSDPPSSIPGPSTDSEAA